jgi:RNA polymerase sigma-70 factor (ECF subfamily)
MAGEGSHPVQRFPTTRWSIVVAAQGARTETARQALERLFETYWYPVYAFIRIRTRQPADAEDLTQGFFASLLALDSIDSVRPERGRFRAFLLGAAKHYLSAERARAGAQKRGGGQAPLSLDFASGERRYRMEPALDMNPELQFEREWARAALDAAREKLRREFAGAGNAVQFEALRPYLTANEDAPSYAQTAAGLEMTETAVKIAIHRARRHFGRVLRDEIAQTMAAEREHGPEWERAVDEEMRYLLRILGR